MRLLVLSLAACLLLAPCFATEPSVAAPSPSWTGVSDLTRLICGGAEDKSYNTRILAIRQLGRSIPANDFSCLRDFLEKDPASENLEPLAINAIKNDIAGKLLVNEFLPDDFTKRFLAMADAPQVGIIWQNYTIQFLDLLWKRENDPAVRQAIVQALERYTQDTRTSIAGTALLTLSRMPEGAQITPAYLGELAIRTVRHPAIQWQDKVTALQIAARVGDSRALPQARIWAVDEQLPVILRMSALAVLGDRGNATDRPTLERFAKSGEFRLRSAAKAALKRLDQAAPAQAKEYTPPTTLPR